jgi:hypothetical protein
MLFTARKANDILRDKLTDITSQYADAMERLHIAESTHANQTDVLRVALDDLHNASAIAFILRKTGIVVNSTGPDLLVAARTAKLDATHKELSDVLATCAVAKENVDQLDKR